SREPENREQGRATGADEAGRLDHLPHILSGPASCYAPPATRRRTPGCRRITRSAVRGVLAERGRSGVQQFDIDAWPGTPRVVSADAGLRVRLVPRLIG